MYSLKNHKLIKDMNPDLFRQCAEEGLSFNSMARKLGYSDASNLKIRCSQCCPELLPIFKENGKIRQSNAGKGRK